jgi:hypothetical protein
MVVVRVVSVVAVGVVRVVAVVAVQLAPLLLLSGLLCSLQLSLGLGRGRSRRWLVSDLREERATSASDANARQECHIKLESNVEADDRGVDPERSKVGAREALKRAGVLDEPNVERRL